MFLPTDRRKLTGLALEMIRHCRASAGERALEASNLEQWRETGTDEGPRALYNKLYSHVDRKAGYLFAPANLRFEVEFERLYGPERLAQGQLAGRLITRSFSQRNMDLVFADATNVALTHGAAIVEMARTKRGPRARLIPPWQFGVDREDLNDLEEQEVLCKTEILTKAAFWRRIWAYPDAEGMLKRALRGGAAGPSERAPNVIIAGSSPVVQTAAPFVVQSAGVASAGMGADVTDRTPAPRMPDEVIILHTLTVVDDKAGDYTTIQIAEPDVLIEPFAKRRNLWVPDEHPYVLVQANRRPGYFWGRSELMDLIRLQALLRDRVEDLKRLMALQFDRIYGFAGFAGMNDEQYDHLKEAGWIANENPSAKIEDLTPKLPPETFADITTIIRFMDELAGFNNVLGGQGEPGVRAGNHARMLMKTASPRLRDQALLVERQCAEVADKLLDQQRVDDATAYSAAEEGPDGSPATEFLLGQLPEDAMVVVDSHTSSPIYEDDHANAIGFLSRMKAIDGESLIDLLPVPMKDVLKERLKAAQKREASFIQQHPEVLAGAHKKAGGSHGR